MDQNPIKSDHLEALVRPDQTTLLDSKFITHSEVVVLCGLGWCFPIIISTQFKPDWIVAILLVETNFVEKSRVVLILGGFSQLIQLV